MSDDLQGTPVLVHPDLPHDPARKQNEIGLIRIANVFCDEFLVGFADEKKGLYAADALLVLLPAEEIHQNLADLAYETPFAELKALTQIDLFLRYGSESKKLAAMQLARDNPAVRLLCLDTLQNQIIKNIDQKFSR